MRYCPYCQNKNGCKLYLTKKLLTKHIQKKHLSQLIADDPKKYDDLMHKEYELRIKKLEKQNQWFLVSMYEEFDKIRNRQNKKYIISKDGENIIYPLL